MGVDADEDYDEEDYNDADLDVDLPHAEILQQNKQMAGFIRNWLQWPKNARNNTFHVVFR